MNKILKILIVYITFQAQDLGSSIVLSHDVNVVSSPIEDILSRLVWVESSNKHYAYSKSGAIGRYQITPICLEDFNTFNTWGLKFTIDDVWRPSVNELIGRWYFKLLLKYHHKDHFGRIVNVVNSYNMGMGNTGKGRYNYSYLKKIIPDEWATVRLLSKFIRYEPRSTIVRLNLPNEDKLKLFTKFP
jgi:soluble lytic murein transglycosylase-like protein